MSGKKKQPTNRAKGRPPKGAAPALPAEEVDRLLVFGEVVACDDGESQTVSFPSYRDLAERFSVSTTLVAKYSREHNCMRRRQQAKARIQAQADQKLVELRATAVALSKDDELRIIDGFLSGFEKALAEGRVRFDNPGDFNTMVRLKEFVLGGADSRQEIHASLSLEDIQARHQRMIRIVSETAPSAVRGELSATAASMVIDVDSEGDENPPRRSTEAAAGDLNVHLLSPSTGSGDEPVGRAHAPVGRPVEPVRFAVARDEEAEPGAMPGGSARDHKGSGASAGPSPRAARVLPRRPEQGADLTDQARASSPATEMHEGGRVHLSVHQADDGDDADGR